MCKNANKLVLVLKCSINLKSVLIEFIDMILTRISTGDTWLGDSQKW